MSCVMSVSVSLLVSRVLCSPSEGACLWLSNRPIYLSRNSWPNSRRSSAGSPCRTWRPPSLQIISSASFLSSLPLLPTRLLPAPEPSRTPLQHRSHLLSALLLLAHALPCRRKSSCVLFTHRTPKDLSPWVPVQSLGCSTTSAGPVVLHQTNLKHTSDWYSSQESPGCTVRSAVPSLTALPTAPQILTLPPDTQWKCSTESGLTSTLKADG